MLYLDFGLLYHPPLLCNPQIGVFQCFHPSVSLSRLPVTRSGEINQFASLVEGGLLLRFDDTGSKLITDEYQDTDFDDFVVGIGGYEDCLYPTDESALQ